MKFTNSPFAWQELMVYYAPLSKGSNILPGTGIKRP
jgi:hypothetical protein